MAVKNEFEALGEAYEVDQQNERVKFKVVVTEAAVERIPRVERKIKQERMSHNILDLMEKSQAIKNNSKKNTKHCIRKSGKKKL